MFELFRGSARKLQEQIHQLAHELNQLRGDVTNRLQQVEEEYARIRLQRTLHGIHEAVDLAIRIGVPAALAIGKVLRQLRLYRAARREA
jgi:hypothetical protein